jgi:hypothetical protein
MMTLTFEYELFVVHADADADTQFVHGYLLPSVGLAPERVLLSSVLALGAPRAAEIERGVQTSRLTVVVLSPACLSDRWTEFGEQLATYVSGVGGRLVPLLRADCELPLRIKFKIGLDFRDPGRWSEEAERLRAHLQQPAPAPTKLPCPYPGMRPYSAITAAYFHGREAEIAEMLGRLRAGEREIYVIGPSGSGKSSLVAAGVLPRLADGVPGLGPFLIRSMRPGEQPTARLREALELSEESLVAPGSGVETLLARHTADMSVLLVVDQLEELFTLASADARTKFLEALRALRTKSRCIIISMLRADFFGDFMECPLWTDRRGGISRIEVSPLRGKALRAAIVQPARVAGVFFEPDLIERLLADAASEPGILPLLQETLIQLWGRRRLRLLTLVDYQALGDGDRSGLAVALARHADGTLRKLTPTQERIAHRILLRLITFGEGRSDTRRQQPRSKLCSAHDNTVDFDAVLQHLIADRLLTTDRDEGSDARVDLAHEIMIAAWPTLAGLLQTRRTDEQYRRRLEAAAAQWVQRGRGPGGLLDPIELAETEAWRKTDTARELGETADVTAMVEASRATIDKQTDEANKAAARRRQVRRFAVGAGVAVILLLAVIAMTAISVARAQEQELQRDVLRTNAYAAHALAGAVAFHLREKVDAAVATAADPDVVRALHNFDHEVLEQRRIGSPFDTVSLYDRSGIARVQSSPVATHSRNLGKDYSWRDYFLGARRLGEAGLRAGYISRAVLSESDGIWMFGIAAPVYDEDRWAGVLLATIGTDSALGRQRLDRTSDDGPMAVIVAPQDRSRATTKGEGEYVVILHDGLTHGAGIVMDSPRLRELRATRTERKQLVWSDPEPITDDAHRDPVPGYEGRWLAGFAPVGDTGFIVIVQTRYDAAVEPNARLSRSFARRAGAVILVGIMLSGLVLFIHRLLQRWTSRTRDSLRV